MRPEESKKFHEVADKLWELAKQAKEDRHYELEDTLKALVDMMHARGSGLRSKYDSII